MGESRRMAAVIAGVALVEAADVEAPSAVGEVIAAGHCQAAADRPAGGALRRRPLCGGVATFWSLPRLPLRRFDTVLRSVLAQRAHNPVNRLLGGWEMLPSPKR